MAASARFTITAKDKSKKATDSAKKNMSRLGKVAKQVGAMVSVSMGIMAARKVVQGIGEMVRAYGVQEQVLARLNQTLKSTKYAAGLSSAALQQHARELQSVTKFGDETIMSAQALMLTFTKIGSDVFPQATETILDMSEAMGQDLQSTVIQVGKALNDPILGVTALRRVGVQLSKEQEDLVDSFMAVNDVAGAQKVILGELETQFGGVARAAADTASGAMTQFHNTMGDVKEMLGAELAPALSKAAQGLKKVFEWAIKMNTLVKDLRGWKALYRGMEVGANLSQNTRLYAEVTKEIKAHNLTLREAGGLTEADIAMLEEKIAVLEDYKKAIVEAQKVIEHPPSIEPPPDVVGGGADGSPLAGSKSQVDYLREVLRLTKAEGGEVYDLALEWEKVRGWVFEAGSLGERLQATALAGMSRKMVKISTEVMKQAGVWKVIAGTLHLATGEMEDQAAIIKDVLSTGLNPPSSGGGGAATGLDAPSISGGLPSLGGGQGRPGKNGEFEMLGPVLNSLQEIVRRLPDPSKAGGFKLPSTGQPIDYGAGTWSQGDQEQVGPSQDMWADFAAQIQQQNENLAAFGEGLLGAATESAGFAGDLLQAGLTMGPVGLALEALKIVIAGVFEVLGPAINGVLQPLVNVLFSLGQIIGALLLPVIEMLTPIMEILAQIIMTVVAPYLMLFAPLLAIVAAHLEMLQPILKALAVVIEVVMAPVKWLGDLFMWVADVIKTAVHNLVEWFEHPLDAEARDTWGPVGAFESDAFSGLAGRIEEIWTHETEGLASDVDDYYQTLADQIGDTDLDSGFAFGGNAYNLPEVGGGGSGASYQARKLTVNIVVNTSAIVGEDGIRQFAIMIRDEIGAAQALGL